MKAFSFTKLSGAGNDFILFDKKLNPELRLSAEIIQKICERRKSIGADGVLVISDLQNYAFDMKYFNADGSSGVLCANGARCALRYGSISGRVNSGLVKFRANDVEYSGLVIDENKVKFFFNQPKKIKYNFKIKTAGQLLNASYAFTGAPHLVIKAGDVLENPEEPKSFYKNIDELPVVQLGRELRYSPDFAPEGTNVNFIQVENGEIKIRTYERGVENETLACGTGSVASALVSFVNDKLKTPIKLHVKSGDILEVDFKVDDQKVRDLALTGPAKVIFNGELSI